MRWGVMVGYEGGRGVGYEVGEGEMEERVVYEVGGDGGI